MTKFQMARATSPGEWFTWNSPRSRRDRRAVVGLSLLLCTMLAGCRPKIETPVPPPEAAPEKTVTLPEVTQTADEIRQEMKKYPLFSPQLDEAQLKLTILLEKDRKAHGVDGYQEMEPPPTSTYNSPTVFADAKTRRVAWRAMACWNPDCPGRGQNGGPFLFTVEYSWVTVGSDGKLKIGAPNAEEMSRPVYCPACKAIEYIRPYDLPESAVREKELKAELNQAYTAYATAAKEGQPIPAGMRSPQKIIKEIEKLPKLYLLSEPGKVKNFDAITAPISGGLGPRKK